MTFSKRFKELRESLGLTQQEMAYKLHKQQSDISKIENNEKEMTISEIRELRTRFHLSNETMLHLIFGRDSQSVTSSLRIREQYEEAEVFYLYNYLVEHPHLKKIINRMTHLPDKNKQYIEQILYTLINFEEKRK